MSIFRLFGPPEPEDSKTVGTANAANVYPRINNAGALVWVGRPGLALFHDWTAAPPPVIPVPNFSGGSVSGCAPLSVAFSDDSTNPEQFASWAWDFQNNGSTDSTEHEPTFVYESPGTYSVKFTGYTAGGTPYSITKTAYITASDCSGENCVDYAWEMTSPGYQYGWQDNGDGSLYAAAPTESGDQGFYPRSSTASVALAAGVHAVLRIIYHHETNAEINLYATGMSIPHPLPDHQTSHAVHVNTYGNISGACTLELINRYVDAWGIPIGNNQNMRAWIECIKLSTEEWAAGETSGVVYDG